MKTLIIISLLLLTTGCASLDDRTNQRLAQSVMRSLQK